MLGEAISQHARAIIMQVDAAHHIVDLSPAAEATLGRSRNSTLGKLIWDYIEEDVALTGALTRATDFTIFDHQIQPKFGPSVKGDVHIMPKENHIIIWIYALGRNIQLERTDAARVAANMATGMAAILAHEIRNPLSSIRGAAQLLSDSVDEADQEFLSVISEESDRIGRLVAEFEDMAGSTPANIEAVNIHKLLDQVQRAAKAGYGQNVVFMDEFDPSLPDVACDSDRMLRALQNIIKNACEAIFMRFGDQLGKGRIVLRTRYRTGIRRQRHGALPVEISIIDNGGGIAPELADEVFKPFVTTKSKGTGLGLSVVAQMVQEIGGAIEYQNEGEGAAIKIYVPVFGGSFSMKNQGEDL